jgi:hypothetical protein
MKTILLKIRIFTMLFAAFAIGSLPSCIWDDETPEPPFEASLVGTWDITSYVLDDDEWMGLIAEEASITFIAPTNHSGIFTQAITFSDGDTLAISGRFIVDVEHQQVTMFYEGEPILADIKITGGNKMLWESIQDQFPLVIKATKRK